VLVAVCASLALVVLYAALGGTSFEPAAVANPCEPRERDGSGGLSGALEQVALSGFDGAACSLGVSREELVLALRSDEALARFARERGISAEEAEEAVTSALVRAVDDAEASGALPGLVARIIRGAAERLPPRTLLELLDRLRR
jgi:hypothetical protein